MYKSHIIDDQSQLRDQALEIFRDKQLIKLKKNFSIISIIGSQSSGKSTLLNHLFQTKFEVLNRKQRIGQTTRGIWFSSYKNTPVFVFDVQGSDSNQRMEERLKIERRNSLFSLALSNVLLINIWTQQLGLFKGSQLEILEIILQLNLKLFGSEKPKQIIFIVRDYEEDNQNKDQLQKDLAEKVQNSWNKINKPKDKQNIKLEDLFTLKVFFMHSLLYQKQQFVKDVQQLRQFLLKISMNQQKFQKNVLVQDLPVYINNVWNTIQSQKDIDLPAEKVMIADLRCNQLQKQAFSIIEQQFNDLLDKATHKLNLQFIKNGDDLLRKSLNYYQQKTQNYQKQQVQKYKFQLITRIERLIDEGSKSQISLLSQKIINQVIQKYSELNLNQRNQSITKFKQVKIQAEKKFKLNIQSILSKKNSFQNAQKQFSKILNDTVEAGKDKILIQYIKKSEMLIKKKIQTSLSKNLKNKQLFLNNNFWHQVALEYYQILKSGQNSLMNFFKQLEISIRKIKSNQYIQRSKKFCYQQLKSLCISKIKDIGNYLLRHFKSDFNLDQKNIPRDWPTMKQQSINQLYKRTKTNYQNSLKQFQKFDVQQENKSRSSMIDISQVTEELAQMSFQQQFHNKMILIDIIKYEIIKKKFVQNAENQYNQAMRKHNQQYNAKTPKWIYVLLVVFMIDDILLMFKSPFLMIPVTIIGLLIALLFALGGKSTGMSVLNQLKSLVMDRGTNLATNLIINSGGGKKQN